MPTTGPAIAFVTMVRDDHVFLRLWINHYSRHVPRAHLFILLDGLDQKLPEFAAGCQGVILPRLAPGPGWDMRRWTLLADFNATLLGRFDVVVLNDVDEIIVADPAMGTDLLHAVARARDVGVITPFAVEVVHRFDLCPGPIDLSRPILAQRPHVRVDETYAKPCITAVPVRWNLGGHRSDFPTLTLDPCLYLFHLRFMDRTLLHDRQTTRTAIRQASGRGKPVIAGRGWAKSTDAVDSFLLSLQKKGTPLRNGFNFTKQRDRMTAGWQRNDATQLWQLGRTFNRLQTYHVPERFHDLL